MRNVEPLPVGALELNAPVVRAHDVLHDGEPQAAALALAREAVVDAVELLEDAAVLDARDAVAVVGHLEGDAWRAPRARAGVTDGRACRRTSRRCESRLTTASTIAARSTWTVGQAGLDSVVKLDLAGGGGAAARTP